MRTLEIRLHKMVKPVVAALILLLIATPASAKKKEFRFHTVYVGTMGSSDEAERFRLLLQGELSKQGFVVSDDATKADMSLSGILVVRVYDEESTARATINFRRSDGTVLTRNFEPHVGWGSNDAVQRRAVDVAKFLVWLAGG